MKVKWYEMIIAQERETGFRPKFSLGRTLGE